MSPAMTDLFSFFPDMFQSNVGMSVAGFSLFWKFRLQLLRFSLLWFRVYQPRSPVLGPE